LQVKSVFVLVRGKKQQDANQRLARLLTSPVFNLLHKQASDGQNVFVKVQAVEGDLLLPGLGISPADKEMLQQVDFVLHCAASVELQADIQKTLWWVQYLCDGQQPVPHCSCLHAVLAGLLPNTHCS
jgi:fatty acyl-CoA reductase